MQEVNLKILAGQADERRRIGRDTHDGISQSFADGIIRLLLAEQPLDRDIDRVRSELDDLRVGFHDGRGFDVANLANGSMFESRYGLATMEERAKLAGGTMQLESRPDAGTSLRFSIPID